MTRKESERPSVLIIDDDKSVHHGLSLILDPTCALTTAMTAHEARVIIASKKFSLVFLDLHLPDEDGFALLSFFVKEFPHMPVIVLTADDSAKKAVVALRAGAYTYIGKPYDVGDVMTAVQNAVAMEALAPNGDEHHGEQTELHFVGNGTAMRSASSLIARISKTDVTVMIQGESGVGKELAARIIHSSGKRTEHPFIAVNCASIPESLLESELFGHEKGSFTDAHERKIGLIESAVGGTLFLDEIAELSLEMQAKLLRVLESRVLRRVGGTHDIHLDIRLITATNADLSERVISGSFRKDLYYRINVVPLTIPPLRERTEDIPALLYLFLHQYNRAFGTSVSSFDKEALDLLMRYTWPGNVRELRNFVERTTALAQGETIGKDDIPIEFLCGGILEHAHGAGLSLADAVDSFERMYVTRVLEDCKGTQTKAAEKLGIHRNALLNKMKRLGLK